MNNEVMTNELTSVSVTTMAMAPSLFEKDALNIKRFVEGQSRRKILITLISFNRKKR